MFITQKTKNGNGESLEQLKNKKVELKLVMKFMLKIQKQEDQLKSQLTKSIKIQ